MLVGGLPQLATLPGVSSAVISSRRLCSRMSRAAQVSPRAAAPSAARQIPEVKKPLIASQIYVETSDCCEVPTTAALVSLRCWSALLEGQWRGGSRS